MVTFVTTSQQKPIKKIMSIFMPQQEHIQRTPPTLGVGSQQKPMHKTPPP
jgi:hypothetical protein